MENVSTSSIPQLVVHCANSELSTVVESIGTPSFCSHLLQFLHEICDGEHCALYRLDGNSVKSVASGSVDGTFTAQLHATRYVREQYWRRDPDMLRALFFQSAADPMIVRTGFPDAWDVPLRETIYPDVSDRLIIAGRGDHGAVAISVVRTTKERFSENGIEALSRRAHLLLCALSRHVNILLEPYDVSDALEVLVAIEECLVAMTSFPRREVEVAARLLYGSSATRISEDLGIGIESVKTYRKRTYERLNIHNERGLLKWYLRVWSSWRTVRQQLN